MRHRGREGFLATSQASKSSLLLGSHVWQVFNDSKSCLLNRVSYRTTLTLHACKSAGQFACGNAFCIDMERRCDGKVDCRDASDEQDCGILLLEPGYNKMLTPAPLDGSSDLLVNISLNLLDVLDINELDEVFKVKIAMKREWFDSRLSFKHLKKKDSNRNDLPEAEGESIWYPSVTFNNIEGSDQLKATHVKNTHRIIPNENFSFEHKDNVHLFKGSASKLSLTKQWTVEFICHYDIGVSNKGLFPDINNLLITRVKWPKQVWARIRFGFRKKLFRKEKERQTASKIPFTKSFRCLDPFVTKHLKFFK